MKLKLKKQIKRIDRMKRMKYILSFIILILFINSFTFNIQNLNNIQTTESENMEVFSDDEGDVPLYVPKMSTDGDLFEGAMGSLTVNDSAILHNTEQYEVGNGSISPYSSESTNYYLDDVHGWKANKYGANITNIVDNRNWIQNGDMGSANDPENDINYTRIYDSILEYYSKNSNYETFYTINHGYDWIRIHFIEMYGYFPEDVVSLGGLSDDPSTQFLNYTGYWADFTTPWIHTSDLTFRATDDGDIYQGGINIDYYEVYNDDVEYSDVSNSDWTYFSSKEAYSDTELWGNITIEQNRSAMVTYMKGEQDNETYYTYYSDNDRSGYYQLITIPRGEVIDATISFDYNLEYAQNVNDFNVFININEDKIFSRGFQVITDGVGQGTWKNSGELPIVTWTNGSKIFNNPVQGQTLNLSIGIETNAGWGYPNAHGVDLAKFLFDNIKLVLSTSANSTQSDIDLTFDTNNASDLTGNSWGNADYLQSQLWETDPVAIDIDTAAPHIYFDLESSLYGYHMGTTYDAQFGNPGTNLRITEDGQIIWDYYHNVFLPTGYQDLEFLVDKPIGWNITMLKDPTGTSTIYEGGTQIDEYVKVNKNYATYSGWWHLQANSTNRIDQTNTNIWNGASWQALSTINSNPVYINVGEYFQIDSVLDAGMALNLNIDTTHANLTIYDPLGAEYHTEEINPQVTTGDFTFSPLYAGALNTTAGTYTFKVIWTNGTQAGAFTGEFQIKHDLEYRLLFPKDATDDLKSEKYYGDVISVRVYLNDSDNGDEISAGFVKYTWVGPSNVSMLSIGAGIYESSLDTSDLGAPGIYNLDFYIGADGFDNITFSLELVLVEETEISLEYSGGLAELGENITVTLDYTTLSEGDGLLSANIELNLSSSNYHITPGAPGEYQIEINTTDYTMAGFNYIEYNVTKVNYQSQVLVDRISLQPNSMRFAVWCNTTDVTNQAIYNMDIDEEVNISVQIFKALDQSELTTGTLELKVGATTLEPSMTYSGDKFYYTVGASQLSLGVNFLTLLYSNTNIQTNSTSIQISVSEIESKVSLNYVGDLPQLGQNLTVILDYTRLSGGAEISGANIELNISSANYFITYLGSGQYQINISTVEYTQSGSNYIEYNITKTDYENQFITDSFTIQPNTIRFVLYINGTDVSSQPYTNMDIDENILIGVEVFKTLDQSELTTGTLALKNGGTIIIASIVYTVDKFYYTLNATQLGIGTSFLNLVYSANNIQTNSTSLQVSVTEIATKVTTEQLDEIVYLGGNMIIELLFQTEEGSKGIGGADIWLNINNTFYMITEPEVGRYLIELSTKWFNSSGFNYIKYNITKNDYEQQKFTDSIIISSVSVSFKMNITIDGTSYDITSSKTKTIPLGSEVSFGIEIFNSQNSTELTTGDLRLQEGVSIDELLVFDTFSGTFQYNTTSDILEGGIHYLNFIYSAPNYQTNITQCLIFIEDLGSELTIIQLQSSVEYKQNITVLLQYNESVSGNGIENATIVLTDIDSIYYNVVESGTPGSYYINISTINFTNSGLNLIEFNVAKKNFVNQLLVQSFQLSPIDTIFTVYCDGIDHTLNKSSSILFQEDLFIEVRISQLNGGSNVSTGTLTLISGGLLNEEMVFNPGSGNYELTIDSTDLGIGYHFLSLIYNNTDYLTKSSILQLKIEKMPILFEVVGGENILSNPGEEFEIEIIITDLNSDPIIGAEITFSWVLGTGNLEDLGNGHYILRAVAPDEIKTFDLTINIDAGSEFEPISITIDIITSELSDFLGLPQEYLYIIGAIMAAVLIGLTRTVAKNRRVKKLELIHVKMVEKTQILDDINNLQGLMVIEKNSGLLLCKETISTSRSHTLDEHLFTGFLQAIMIFSKEFADGNSSAQKHMITAQSTDEFISSADYAAASDMTPDEIRLMKYPMLEFARENFNILIIDGNVVRLAIILKKTASDKLKDMSINLIESFEVRFHDKFNPWDGQNAYFYPDMTDMMNICFNLKYLENYSIETNKEKRAKLKRVLVPEGTLHATVYRYAKLFNDEREYFKINSIINLIDKSNRLKVKEIILDFIEQGLFVKYKGNEVLIPDEIQPGLTSILRKIDNVEEKER